MPAGGGGEVGRVGDADGGELLVQAVVAAEPVGVGRVAGEPDVRGELRRVDVQDGRVLAARLAGD